MATQLPPLLEDVFPRVQSEPVFARRDSDDTGVGSNSRNGSSVSSTRSSSPTAGLPSHQLTLVDKIQVFLNINYFTLFHAIVSCNSYSLYYEAPRE